MILTQSDIVSAMASVKRCSAHFGGKGAALPLSAFHKDRNSLDGHCDWCKACRNEKRRLLYAKKGASMRDMFCSARCRAARLKVQFDLTLDQFADLLSRPCVYGGGRRPELNIGIDRKSPGADYTIENVVACCGRHNRIKSDLFTFESMLRIVREFEEARACADTPRITPRKARSIA